MEHESESAVTDQQQDLKSLLDATNGENAFTSENNESDTKPSEKKECTQSPSSKDGAKSDSISPPPNSPEPSCVICLGPLQNKSFTDSCFHTFCFNCLLSWSKVKAECPLCKQKFKSIVHNVRSIEDYDQYYIAARTSETSWQNPDGRRFRYSTTLTAERVLERRQRVVNDENRQTDYQLHRLTYAPHSVSSYASSSSSQSINEETLTASIFRQRIYNDNLWVRQPNEVTKYRCTSPNFYRQNPACAYRLVPWLNRELVALLCNSQTRVTFVLDFILALIMRYDIRSEEFYVRMQPYLGNRTAHFVHEFFSYASSPYDIAQYDDNATYDRQETFNDTILLSSPGSDVTPLVGSDNPVIINSSASTSGTSRKKSSTKVQQKRVRKLHLKRDQENDLWNISVSSPAVSCNTTLDFYDFSAFDPENVPGPSASDSRSSSVLPTVQDYSSDEDCIVVKVVKPRSERTPEIIDLAVSSEDEAPVSVETVQNVSEDTQVSNGLTLLLRASEFAEADDESVPSTSVVTESESELCKGSVKKKPVSYHPPSTSKRQHSTLSSRNMYNFSSSSTSDIDEYERLSTSSHSRERSLSSFPVRQSKDRNVKLEHFYDDSTDISDCNSEDAYSSNKKHAKVSNKSKLHSVVASMTDHCYVRSDSSHHSSHSKKHKMKHKKKKKHEKHKHHKHRSHSEEK